MALLYNVLSDLRSLSMSGNPREISIPMPRYTLIFLTKDCTHACPDTPDVKSTFQFNIRSSLPVLASGLVDGTEDISGSNEKLYKFKQDVPIPSYLFAIASGDIAKADIGPRSTVWTGPEELEGAKWELEADTETFIKAAEKIVYPYAWGTYNVLVLPPSFPYGGMFGVSLWCSDGLLTWNIQGWRTQSTLSPPQQSSVETVRTST